MYPDLGLQAAGLPRKGRIMSLKWMTLGEASSVLGLSVQKVYARVRGGEVPFRTKDGRVYVVVAMGDRLLNPRATAQIVRNAARPDPRRALFESVGTPEPMPVAS